MVMQKILPETGRWQSAGLTEGGLRIELFASPPSTASRFPSPLAGRI